MDCSIDALIESAKCFRCIPAGALASVSTYLLCQWSNKPTCDPDALTFLSTVGIDQASATGVAVCNLVSSLKNTGTPSFWSRDAVIYPFVGGLAATHAINLKSPGSNTIAFGGGVTHTNKGIVGDGASGFGDTGYVVSSQNSARVMCYVDARPAAGLGVYWGCRDPGQTIYEYFQFRGAATNANCQMNGAAGASSAIEQLGANFVQRQDAANLQFAWAANTWTTFANASTGLTNVSINLLALWNNVSRAFFSGATISGWSIGSPLTTDAEMAAYRAIWNTFETAMGRGH